MGGLTWGPAVSFSAGKNFRECQRRWFLGGPGAWHGWERWAPEHRRTAYLFKNATSFPQLAGTVLHESIARVLKEGIAPGRDRIELEVPAAEQEFRRIVAAAKQEGWRRSPKKSPLVQELYFGQSESQIEKARQDFVYYRERLATQLRAALSGEVLAKVFEDARLMPMKVDELEKVTWRDLPLWVALDVRMGDFGERSYLVDWKTGKPRESDVEQVLVYMDATGIREAKLVYLATGEVNTVQHPTPEEIAPIYERLRGFYQQVVNVTGKEERPDTDDDWIEAFPMNEGTQCGRCEFMEICHGAST